MAAREKYALVFWLEEPRSADTVLKTDVLPDPAFPMILPNQTRKVMWGREEHLARIITTGLKTQLAKLRVSRDGELVTDVGPETMVVTTRRKALAIIESRAQKNLLANQDELDQLVLVEAGREPRLPANGRPQVPAGLEARLMAVPALQDHAGDDNWIDLGEAFIPKLRLHILFRKYKKVPVKLYRALLVELLTEELLATGQLSCSGRGGTSAKVPQRLLDAALAYTSTNCHVDFDVARTTSNLFGDYRKKAKKVGLPGVVQGAEVQGAEVQGAEVQGAEVQGAEVQGDIHHENGFMYRNL